MQRDYRHILLRLIIQLQARPPEKDAALAELNRLRDELEAPEHVFDIPSIIWGSSFNALMHPLEEWEPGEIHALQQELLGFSGTSSTYALKYPFVDLLTPEGQQAYEHIKLMLAERLPRLSQDPPDLSLSDAYTCAAEAVYAYHTTLHAAHTVADLVLGHLCSHLYQLPDTASFDILDEESHRFSSILPRSGVVDVRGELLHLDDMLRKLEGSAVLFVEVGILPHGYMLNLR